MLRKLLSYTLGFVVGLLAIAPPLNYKIPVVVNSYWWLYGLVVFGFLGVYLIFTELPVILKAFIPFVLATCFVSQSPYISFHAYILMVAATYCYLGFLKADYEPILNMVAAAFWFEFILTIAQLCGKDTLMHFGSNEKVFLGTVMQYMRFSSLLAIMTPLLVLKDKRYIFPILLFCVISRSSSFALAVLSGTTVYCYLVYKNYRRLILLSAFLGFVGYCVWDRGSIITALDCGRIPVWGDIIRTWVMDTSHEFVLPLRGDIDWKSILIGRGLDTFFPLFPIFKHDLNPFPQAHNDLLQLLWELGVIGASMLYTYYLNLTYRLRGNPLLVSGLACMSVNMFFAFPTRITQAMLMMVCYIAYCEREARNIEKGIENVPNK